MKVLIPVLLVVLSIGIYTISDNIGTSIERSSWLKERAANQRLSQQNAEWQLEQKERLATADNRVWLRQSALWALTIALPGVIILSAIILLRFQKSMFEIKAKEAQWNATQIRMDPETRSYPMITFQGANGQLRLHDPNTKVTMALDNDHEAVPLLVNSSTLIQLQSLAGNNQIVNPEGVLLLQGEE